MCVMHGGKEYCYAIQLLICAVNRVYWFIVCGGINWPFACQSVLEPGFPSRIGSPASAGRRGRSTHGVGGDVCVFAEDHLWLDR